ncbi:MAG TPA: YIP1 family protein [Chloroflexia bacterium]|nr:YIP1 family protein [Chloroflexia bacterium]
MSYQPPPDQGSGNTEPGSEYSTPPEASGGSYTPPPAAPSGGYTPPPATSGGGYSPPPMTTMTTTSGDPSNMAHLPQSYMNAVTKPSVGTYEAEIPNASPVKTLIGVAIVAIVTFLFSLIFAGAAASSMASMFRQFGGSSAANIDPAAFAGGTGITAALFGLIFTFIGFYIGAGIQYLTAKLLGGQGQGFGTHAYLDSLSYTPIKVVSIVIGIIPVIGGLIGFVLGLYQMYLQGLGIQASQRLPAGKAMLAAFMPLIIGLVLSCLAVFACAGLIASIAGSANR